MTIPPTPRRASSGGARAVISIELLLDEASESLVRADWERRAAAGHSSMAAHRSDSNRPHITLLVRPADAVPVDARAFVAATAHLPVRIHLADPIVFAHGDRAVLARRVVLTDAVRALHADVHAAIPPGDDAPHTAPGEWTPHVTLARRLRLDALDEARALLHPPHTAAGVALRRWDSAARLVTDIPLA